MSYIAVFAYAFPHRKTQDFLRELAKSGCNKVCVIAAPWKDLGFQHSANAAAGSVNALPVEPLLSTQDICQSLGMAYICLDHSDVDGILQVKQQYEFECGLIAGARIIPPSVINIFSEGIINFHPGKLPETSGLDAFFYSIKKNIAWGVTAHFIDARVDAGQQIFFKPLGLDATDTPSTAREKMHWAQLLALKDVLHMRASHQPLKTTDIIRPTKNSPMTEEEKQRCLSRFSAWVAATHGTGL